VLDLLVTDNIKQFFYCPFLLGINNFFLIKTSMNECGYWFFKNIVNFQARNPEWIKFTGLIKEKLNRTIRITHTKDICEHIDHIALRAATPVHNMGNILDKLKKFGYEEKDTYDFPSINVRAKWFKHPIYPRIFLSEQNPYNLSPGIKIIMNKIKDEFRPLSLEEYDYIKEESQYLAWTLTNSLAFNHVAINLNNLGINIEEINDILLKNEMELNRENNKYIKISKDKKLLQSSTIATRHHYITYDKEIILIPGPFIEFIERKDGRDGFEPENALEIFSSTK